MHIQPLLLWPLRSSLLVLLGGVALGCEPNSGGDATAASVADSAGDSEDDSAKDDSGDQAGDESSKSTDEGSSSANDEDAEDNGSGDDESDSESGGEDSTESGAGEDSAEDGGSEATTGTNETGTDEESGDTDESGESSGGGCRDEVAAEIVAFEDSCLEWVRHVSAMQAKLPWSEVAGMSAAQACEMLDLEGAGWRLPSVSELQTIVVGNNTYPSIDSEKFPDTPPLLFWTSEENATSHKVHALDFSNNGMDLQVGPDGGQHYRCVRDADPS